MFLGNDLAREVLIDLLSIERERLKVALRIEQERRIVFPETTVIIKDIERLLDKILGKDSIDTESGPEYTGDDLLKVLRSNSRMAK